MTETLTALNDWLTANPQWIAIALGLTALIESAAMIGIFIPGVAVLFAASAIGGALDIPLWSCLLAAAIGAIIGDVGSFYLGRFAHGPLLRRWPFRQYPLWIERGERFIAHHGSASVVIGRFVGPIRPVLPFVAGMLKMPPSRFISVNIGSALLWAPAYILPGYLVGKLADTDLAAPENSAWLNVVLLLIIAGGLLILALIHQGTAPNSPRYHALTRNPRWNGLRSPVNGELPLTSVTLLIVSVLGFLALSLTVTLGNPLAPLDHAFAELFRSLRSVRWDPWVAGITSFGDSANLLPLSLLIAVALWLKGDRRGALHWVAAMLLLALLNHLFKEGFGLPRPNFLQQPLDSKSFPSAHSSNSTLFFALCATFVAQQFRYKVRMWIYGLAAIPAAAVCLSRLYLGVHWITDVFAGICLALAVCAATRISYSRFQQRLTLGRWDSAWLLGALLYSVIYLSWRLEPALISYMPLPR